MGQYLYRFETVIETLVRHIIVEAVILQIDIDEQGLVFYRADVIWKKVYNINRNKWLQRV